MAGISIVTQASLNVISAIGAAKTVGPMTQDNWIYIRDKVYEIYKAAGSQRQAYKSNKRAREIIAAQHMTAWELVEVMDLINEEWTVDLSQRALPYIAVAVTNIYTLPTADEISTIITAITAKINSMLTPKSPTSQLSSTITEQMAKFVNTNTLIHAVPTLTVDPETLIAMPDPDDKMD